jgi:hypothetical protein
MVGTGTTCWCIVLFCVYFYLFIPLCVVLKGSKPLPSIRTKLHNGLHTTLCVSHADLYNTLCVQSWKIIVGTLCVQSWQSMVGTGTTCWCVFYFCFYFFLIYYYVWC